MQAMSHKRTPGLSRPAAPKKTAGRKVRVRDVSSKGKYDRRAKPRAIPERKQRSGSNGSGDANGPRAMGADGPPAVRRRLPDERHSLTHHFSVGGQEGYVTVGLYEDGLPGELFIRMAKEGSTVSGLMDSFATAVSLPLQ